MSTKVKAWNTEDWAQQAHSLLTSRTGSTPWPAHSDGAFLTEPITLWAWLQSPGPHLSQDPANPHNMRVPRKGSPVPYATTTSLSSSRLTHPSTLYVLRCTCTLCVLCTRRETERRRGGCIFKDLETIKQPTTLHRVSLSSTDVHGGTDSQARSSWGLAAPHFGLRIPWPWASVSL